MTAIDVVAQAREALSVKRVFGEPYQRNGITLIPVARIKEHVAHLPVPRGEAGPLRAVPSLFGRGADVRMSAKPLGVYVLRGDRVTFKPVSDARCVMCMGGALAVLSLLAARSVRRRRAEVTPVVAAPLSTEAAVPTDADETKTAVAGGGDGPVEGAPEGGGRVAHRLGGRRPHASRRGMRWTAALVAVMVEVSAFVAWRWRIAHAQPAASGAGE